MGMGVQSLSSIIGGKRTNMAHSALSGKLFVWEKEDLGGEGLRLGIISELFSTGAGELKLRDLIFKFPGLEQTMKAGPRGTKKTESDREYGM